MDRPISNKEKGKNRIKALRPILIIALALLLAYLGMRTFLQKRGDRSELFIVSVERGKIRQTLSAAGTVVAAAERVINSPVSTEIQEVLLSSGTNVKAGDLILKLDQEYTKLEYEKLKDELSLRRNSMEKLKLEYDKDLRDLDYRDQIKGLQLSELEAEIADQERLLTIGGATAEEVETAKVKLQIAQIEKKMLENELAFKRKVNATDKNNLQLEYDIQVKRLTELNRKLKETQVRSPQKGVITWLNEDIGKTVIEGEPLVRIANLNRFMIEATSSDRNSEALVVGLPVEVRIGEERLKGQISRVLPEIVNNTVRFYISLEEDNHPALRPNLRTEIYIITNEKEDALRAKRGQGLKGTKNQFFYKVEGDKAIRVRVTKGLVSAEYFEIIDGLREGERLIISDTKDFEHMDQFTIQD